MNNQNKNPQDQAQAQGATGKQGSQDGARYGKEPQDKMNAGGPGQGQPHKGEQPQRSHSDQKSQGAGHGQGAGQGWQSQQRSGNR